MGAGISTLSSVPEKKHFFASEINSFCCYGDDKLVLLMDSLAPMQAFPRTVHS